MCILKRRERNTTQLAEGIGAAARQAGIAVQQTRMGTMFATFFTDTYPHDWSDVKTCDTEKFGRFFQSMLAEGIYLAPSQFEAGFMSTVHSADVIQDTIAAAQSAFRSVV